MNDNTQVVDKIKNRKPDRVGLKEKPQSENTPVTFLTSSSDWGTIRNNGRRGSLFGPEIIITTLKKMAGHQDSNHHFKIAPIVSEREEKEDFNQASEQATLRISKELQNQNSFYIHLGGGHDHLFPMIKAWKNLNPYKKMLIINLDPHLDTRTDDWRNSGTPFRNIDHINDQSISILQIGTHLFANGADNYSPLAKTKMETLHFDELKKITHGFRNSDYGWLTKIISKFDFDTIFISLDVDVYQSESMKAVSAVNHKGLSPQVIEEMVSTIKEHCNKQKKSLMGIGFYEYNPMFDDLANSGARVLASLIYDQFLKA